MRHYGHSISRYHTPSTVCTHRGHGLGSIFRNTFSRIARNTHFRNILQKSKSFIKKTAIPGAKKLASNVIKETTPVLRDLGKQAINEVVDAAGAKVGDLISKASEEAQKRGVPKELVEAVENSANETTKETLKKGKHKLLETLDEVASKKKFTSKLEAAARK